MNSCAWQEPGTSGTSGVPGQGRHVSCKGHRPSMDIEAMLGMDFDAVASGPLVLSHATLLASNPHLWWWAHENVLNDVQQRLKLPRLQHTLNRGYLLGQAGRQAQGTG